MKQFTCVYCGNTNPVKRNTKNKYCSNRCQAAYEYSRYIEAWKAGEVDGSRGKFQVSLHIAKYLRETYGDRCSECGWDKINPTTGKCPLDIDHKDGNPYNHVESNLRLLCPCCHSLTPTYKALNKGNGRSRNMPD